MAGQSWKIGLGLDTSEATSQLRAFFDKAKAAGAGGERMTEPMEQGLQKVIAAAGKVGLSWDQTVGKFRDSSGAVRGIQEVKARLEELEKNTQKAAAAMETLKGALSSGFQNALQGIPQGIGQALGSQLLAPFRAVQEVVAGSGKTFIDLDEALRQTLAAAGESNEKFSGLADSVTTLASSSAFSAKELAGVTTELARAGFTLDDLTKALPGIQSAAAASGEGLQETTANMITALGGFQLGADQAGKVADVMTVAANAAAQSTSDVGEAFKYVAPIAKSLGMTLEDTAGATVLLANAGIKGSQAGTALRSGLGRLAQTAAASSSEFAELSKGTGRMGEVASRLVLTLKDTQGNLLPLPQLVKNLKTGLDGLGSTDKSLVTKILFGDEAGSSWVSLLNNSTAAIDKAFAATNNASGVAARTAAQNLSGISGALKLLDGAIGGFQASVGSVVSAGLQPLVQAATAAINVWNQFPAPVKSGATALVGLVGAASVATAGVLLFNAAMKTELVLGLAAGLRALAAGFSMQAVAANAAAAIGAARTALEGLSSVMQSNIMLGTATSGGLRAMGAAFAGFASAVSSANLASIWESISAGSATAASGVRAFLAVAAPLLPLAVAVGAVALAWDSWGASLRAGNKEAESSKASIKALQAEMAKLGATVSDGQTSWDRSIERVGYLQAALDKLRAAIGLTTAEQASQGQQAVETVNGMQQVLAVTDASIAAYDKAAAAAKGNAQAEEEADKMRQAIVQTLAQRIAALQQEGSALQARKDEGEALTAEEATLLSAIQSSIRALQAQEQGLRNVAAAHKGAAQGVEEHLDGEAKLSKALEDQKARYQDALSAMEQAFKNWKDATEEKNTAANAPIEEAIKKQEKALEGVKAAAEKVDRAHESNAEKAREAYEVAKSAAKAAADSQIADAERTKKAVEAQYDAQIAAVKQAADAASKGYDRRLAQIEGAAAASSAAFENEGRALQRAQQAQQKADSAADKRAQKADADAAKREQAKLASIERISQAEERAYQSETKRIQAAQAEQQRSDDARVRALQAATPSEARLAQLDRARLEQEARLGGEQGLRARAQLERAERQAQIERVQAEIAQRAEQEKIAAEKRQEAYEARKAELETKRAAIQAQNDAAAEKRALAAQLRQEQAQQRQEEFQQRQAALEDSRRASEANYAAQRKQVEEEKQRTAESFQARLAQLEKEKAATSAQAEAGINALKEKFKAQENKAEAEQKKQRKEDEKERREDKQKTSDKVKALEEGIAKLKTTLTEQEKKQKGEIAAAEKVLSQQKVDLEGKYREAIGKTNQYIVKEGTTAWRTYADAAIKEIGRIADAQKALAAVGGKQAARAMGGPLAGGQSAYVNELGQEAFLSRSGDLSLISAPMWGTWRAPTEGTVIPAHLTASLKASGAFAAPAAAAASPGGDGGAMGRLVAALSGETIGRQTNHVTIQSTEPVADASRMLVEMSRLRARARR